MLMVRPTKLGSHTHTKKPTKVLPGQFKIHHCQSCWSFGWTKDSPEIQQLLFGMQYNIYIYISSFYETLKKLHLSLNLSIFILIVLKIHPLVEVVSVKLPDPIGNQAGLEWEIYGNLWMDLINQRFWCWKLNFIPFQVYEFSSEGRYAPIEMVAPNFGTM